MCSVPPSAEQALSTPPPGSLTRAGPLRGRFHEGCIAGMYDPHDVIPIHIDPVCGQVGCGRQFRVAAEMGAPVGIDLTSAWRDGGAGEGRIGIYIGTLCIYVPIGTQGGGPSPLSTVYPAAIADVRERASSQSLYEKCGARRRTLV